MSGRRRGKPTSGRIRRTRTNSNSRMRIRIGRPARILEHRRRLPPAARVDRQTDRRLSKKITHPVSITGMSDRSTCWSITINNPSQEDLALIKTPPAPGWKMVGQIEQGEQGTIHYQGMLTTPQVRFSAVKKVYPRAHIEVARNKQALAAYVQKEDTRIEAVTSTHIPSIFEYQVIIAKRWKQDDFEVIMRELPRKNIDDLAMLYLDSLVSQDIANGQRGAEWIATNPMWRNAWKKFWRSIIKRENAFSRSPTDPPGTQCGSPSGSPPAHGGSQSSIDEQDSHDC